MKRLFRRATTTDSWRLQYASNLYAGKGWQKAWSALGDTPVAPSLALLGNCGSVATSEEAENTFEFLQRCAGKWQRIYWIPGPEEYRGRPDERDAAATDVLAPYTQQRDSLEVVAAAVNSTKDDSLLILDQTEVIDMNHDIIILGATGWTECIGLDRLPPTSLEGSQIGTSQNGLIRPARVRDLRSWHREDIGWIEERLQWWSEHHPEKVVVVLSHHLCSGHLLSPSLPSTAYQRLPLEIMSYDSTHQALDSPNLAAWLCGATGSCTSGLLGSRRRVYAGTNGFHCLRDGSAPSPGFVPHRYLEIEASKWSDGGHSESPPTGNREWAREYPPLPEPLCAVPATAAKDGAIQMI